MDATKAVLVDTRARSAPVANVISIERWIEHAIKVAPNRQGLHRQLEAIRSDTALIRFLHRFVLFNDALAARVPFVAGLIHLTPDIFLDPAQGVGFCQQANGRVAAYVAKAASDEYQLGGERSSVHQHLSQNFLNGVLSYHHVERAVFDRDHPLPPVLELILDEARAQFLGERTAHAIFCSLGFHVGLEFFANQEFNLVDEWLHARFPTLTAALEQKGIDSDYTWLALHTVVEIGHYRAGMEALKSALTFYRFPEKRSEMAEFIKEGFGAFIDLQSRYYDAILSDTV